MYNVEKYLDECVNSVLNQTYRNLEVILVDDGSTYKSPAMCDEWAHRDSRVRVIHKDNGGAALARNAVLETANGAFIATVDSDDFIAPNMYERLYTLLTDNDADLSICEFSLIDEAGNILVMEGNKMPAEVLSGTDALRKFLDGISLNYLYLWNRLHKREIFRDIRFPAGNRHDDTATVHHIFGVCRKIAITDEQLYTHREHDNSVMGKIKNSGFNLKVFIDNAYIYNDRYDYFRSIGWHSHAEYSARALGWIMSTALKKVNYLQYRKELSPYVHDAMKKLMLCGNFGSMLRALRLAIVCVSSIFRPFIDKEKIS